MRSIQLNQKGLIMKKRLAIIGTVLTFVCAMPVFGQATNKTMAKMDDKKSSLDDKAVKPTFEATTAGIQMKVWIMITGGAAKATDMSSAKATSDEQKGSTYHVMVELKKADGKVLTDANASMMAVSPAGKNTSVELKPMMDEYGSDFMLDEKGEYQLTIQLNVGGVPNSTQFKFVAK
jgi:hypothetical protein